MVTECQPFEAMHSESMRNIHIESLAVDNSFGGGILVLWLRLVLLPRAFGDYELMAALVDDAGAH